MFSSFFVFKQKPAYEMRISDWSSDVCSSDLATADGIVERAGRAGGYGNLVEIDHGKGIETRYGHLSKILVKPNQRVKRGQVVALMGSTGRSTGSHLHYEVRIDGRAVNPIPFLQTADYRSEEQTSELQSLMRTSYAVYCLTNKKTQNQNT